MVDSAGRAVVSASRDPVLASLISRAYSSSPLIARARAAADAARARIMAARAPFFPELGLAEKYSASDDPVLAFSAVLEQGSLTPQVQRNLNNPPTVQDWATDLYARYLIFDFGRRRAALAAAREEGERLRLLEEAARRDVRYAVTEAYYGLLASRAAVHLWEDTVRLSEEHEKLARARFEAGAALRSDVLSVRVRVAAARDKEVTARRAAEISRVRLAAAVGMPLEELSVPQRKLGDPVYAADEDSVIKAAREANPVVRALDAAVRAAADAERAAAREGWPRVQGEVRGMWHGVNENPGFARRSYVAGVALEFPIFTGGRAWAHWQEAAARRRELEAARRQVTRELALAARTAHRRALGAVERVPIADAAVRAGEAALTIVRERYRTGLARVVDLLSAERDLTEARLRALQARAAAYTAIAAVERVAVEGMSK